MQLSLNSILIECSLPCIKMRYSIEPRERRYVKGYGFFLLLKTLVTISVINMVKSLLILLKNLQQMH